jgi:hypothetical protein
LYKTILLLVAVIAAMFLGAVGATIWITVYVRNPSVSAALLTGSVALIVAVVGVFQEQIRLALRGPSLECLFGTHGDINVTVEMFFGDDKRLIAAIPAIYVRLRIGNRGAMSAKHVEVIAQEFERRQPGQESFETVPEFTPLNLRWAYTGETYLTQLPPQVEKHCDLFHTRHPGIKPDGGTHPLPYPPLTGAMLFAKTPNVHPALLKAGEVYRVRLVVAAENAPARECIAEFGFPTNLFEGENVWSAAPELIFVRGLSKRL